MASKKHQTRLKRTALCLALGVCFASGVQAQSNTAGVIYGSAQAGDVIIIDNPETGFHREISVSSDGKYRATQTPSGTYRVTVRHADGRTSVRENVVVSVGTGVPVDFTGTTTLNAIEVKGGAFVNPIDVSSVESATIMTEARIDAIAVERDVTNVALLAPGTVRGDGRFGNLASFGGASVAENVYYVNGFNVTNIVTGLAFSQIPFEGIAEQQVKTGGYGAEFGRSLGGVVNLITKRGTNDWKFGANVIWSPKSLNERDRFAYDPERDGDYVVADGGSEDDLTYNIYGGGALFKDKLFMFALLQGNRNDRQFDNEGGSAREESSSPQGMLKLDWNLGERHLIELTAFRDREEVDGKNYLRAPGDLGLGGGTLSGVYSRETGGDTYIGRWTGYLTDTFTLSALYGKGEHSRDSYDSNAESCPIVIDARTSAAVGPLGVQGCWSNSTIGAAGAGDERTAWRIDGEWMIGDHTVRFGLDNEEFDTFDGTRYSGGGYWRYSNVTPGQILPNLGGAIPAGVTEIVRFRNFVNGGNFLTKNSAWYIEDTWRATDTLSIYAGLRNEAFENLNPNGGAFVDVQDTWAPRFGVSWDVNGDSSLKVFGNAGRYYIPVYANTNVRLAGSELFYNEWYTFTSLDPATGTPSGLTQLGDRFYFSNGEVPDPRTVVDNNLEPMYQDEYIIGFQKQFSENLAGGVRAIYRDLKAGMDDICNKAEPYAWAIANGYTEDEADAIADAVNHCFLTNPGADLSANVDLQGDGELTVVNIPAAALGFEQAKRTYKAVELFFEGNWDRLYLQGSYTWARSTGNTEGYVNSDAGQDDAGITLSFDYPGLMEGAFGSLPNDRRHTFKLFGSYDFTEEWSLGGNVVVQSGRPINCLGVYPVDGIDPDAPNYGSDAFFCGDGEYPTSQHPRGSMGRTPWLSVFDAQVVYKPKQVEGLSVRLQVNNLFDTTKQQRVEEHFEDDSRTPRYDYLYPRSIVTPRSVTVQLQYDW